MAIKWPSQVCPMTTGDNIEICSKTLAWSSPQVNCLLACAYVMFMYGKPLVLLSIYMSDCSMWSLYLKCLQAGKILTFENRFYITCLENFSIANYLWVLLWCFTNTPHSACI
jgi:hypothetical protein